MIGGTIADRGQRSLLLPDPAKATTPAVVTASPRFTG